MQSGKPPIKISNNELKRRARLNGEPNFPDAEHKQHIARLDRQFKRNLEKQAKKAGILK